MNDDNADPLGDTIAGSVEPAMQTKEEEAEQEDTEPTQSLQQQRTSSQQAAEPYEKRERQNEETNAVINMSSFSEAFQP